MSANNRLDEFISDVLGFSSRRKFADYIGTTHGAVDFWVNGKRDIPYDLARKHGVNYGWLVGDDAQMWSERVITLRQSLRSYLASVSSDAKATITASDRFRVVLAWLREQAPDLVRDEYITRLLRLDVETYREALDHGDVGMLAIDRLAAFVDVPIEWFATGENRFVEREESLNDLARDYGVSVEDAKQAILREASRRSR